MRKIRQAEADCGAGRETPCGAPERADLARFAEIIKAANIKLEQ